MKQIVVPNKAFQVDFGVLIAHNIAADLIINHITQRPNLTFAGMVAVPPSDKLLMTSTSETVGDAPGQNWMGLRTTILSMERRSRWHGPDSRAIRKSAFRAAFDFVESAFGRNPELPAPDVSPSPRGAVSLLWWFGEISFLFRLFSVHPYRISFHA